MGIDTNEIRSKFHRGRMVTEKEVLSLCDEIDRLQKQNALRECLDQRELANASLRPAAKPKLHGKTSPVDVKVAVDWCGNVAVGEDQFEFLLEPRAYYKLTANLHIPEETKIEAEVENA